MTDRWSNPSGGIGVERFRVWPAGSDSYSHVDLTANWDEADDIIGQPSDASQWPPTLGLDGGIYKEIALLKLEREPIGSVKGFFRPSLTVPIPTGWVPLDGSTLAPDEHDFPGISGSVTLPDLRNATILGADATFALGQAAAVAGSGNIDTAAGAPGGNATGGSNQHIQVEAELAAHNHGGETGPPNVGVAESTSPTIFNVPDEGSEYNSGPTENHVHSIATDGSSAPMNNRQRWVGLVYIVKVLYASSI